MDKTLRAISNSTSYLSNHCRIWKTCMGQKVFSFNFWAIKKNLSFFLTFDYILGTNNFTCTDTGGQCDGCMNIYIYVYVCDKYSTSCCKHWYKQQFKQECHHGPEALTWINRIKHSFKTWWAEYKFKGEIIIQWIVNLYC